MNVIETQHLNIVFYVPFLVVMNVSSPRYVCSGLIRAVSWVRRLVVANWSYQTEQRTWGHGSRLRQSIRWAPPLTANILNQERVVRSLDCQRLSSEKPFLDVTLCVWSSSLRLLLILFNPEQLLPAQSVVGGERWAGLPQTGGWCQHNGGQQSHYSAFCCNWCQHMSRCPRTSTPPPLQPPTAKCIICSVAAPLLLLPIINLFWWSLAPSLAVISPISN